MMIRKLLIALIFITSGYLSYAQEDIGYFYQLQKTDISVMYRGIENLLYFDVCQGKSIAKNDLNFETDNGTIIAATGSICIYPGKKDSLLLKVKYQGKVIQENVFRVENMSPPVIYLSYQLDGKTFVNLSESVILVDKVYVCNLFERKRGGNLFEIMRVGKIKFTIIRGASMVEHISTSNFIQLKALGAKKGDNIWIVGQGYWRIGSRCTINIVPFEFSFIIR